jgi:hypothetical protein
MNVFNIISKVNQNGGITVDRSKQEYKGSGFGVAISKQTEIVVIEDLFLPEVVTKVFSLYDRQLREENVYLGIWKEDGKVFFDLSEVIQNREDAVQAGRQRDQLAIFSFEDLEVIDLNQ